MTWPQPSIDSGREWAIPMRVARGEALYSEVVSFHGPVPVWLHAAAYRLAGERVATPLVLLLPLAALLLGSLHLLVRRAAGPLAAFAGTALAISIALVAPNGGALVFPYSFAALHALAYSALGLAGAAYRSRRGSVVAAAGWGLALASRPEIAAVSIAAAALAFSREGSGWRWPRETASQALFAGAFAAVPWGVALRGVPLSSLWLEGPLVLADPPVEWRAVYRIVSGLASPWVSLSSIATAAALGLGLAVAALLAARLPLGRAGRAVLGALLVAAAAALLVGTDAGRLLDASLPPVLRAAPPSLALLALLLAARPGPRPVALLALVALGALGASRVALGFSYGWTATPYSAVAAPALCAGVAAATALFPARKGALAGALVALAAIQSVRLLSLSNVSSRVDLDTGRGHLRLPPAHAAAWGGAIAWLRTNARPGDELAGFPEAGLLHLSAGLANPLREDQVLPGVLDAAAEEAVVARLRERRPRFVALVNQPSAAFGPASFGVDYDVRLWAAVLEGWRLRASFGAARPDEPVGPGPFFVRIYERRDAAAGPGPAGRPKRSPSA